MKKILMVLLTIGLFSVSAQGKKKVDWNAVLNFNHKQVIETFGIPERIFGTINSSHIQFEPKDIASGNLSSAGFEYDGFTVYFYIPEKISLDVDIMPDLYPFSKECKLYVSAITIEDLDKFILPYGIESSDNFTEIISKLGKPDVMVNSELVYIFKVDKDSVRDICNKENKLITYSFDSSDECYIHLSDDSKGLTYVSIHRSRTVSVDVGK